MVIDMKKLVLMFCFLIVSIPAVCLTDYETIVLTRTNVGLIADGNQLVVQSNKNGEVEIKYPKSHIHHGKTIKFNHPDKSHLIFSLIEGNKSEWHSENLKQKLKQIKVDLNNQIFYSSDSDIINLALIKNDQLIWEITINNLQELKHYYQHLDQWQSLIDLIDEVELLSRNDVVSKLTEKQ